MNLNFTEIDDLANNDNFDVNNYLATSGFLAWTG